MKRTVSLFEFMPYGAPELLAARSSHLARALFVSSLTPVLVFFLLLAIVPMLRTVHLPPAITLEPTRIIDLTNPSIIEPPAVRVAPAIAPSRPVDGVMVPVPRVDDPIPPVTQGGPPDVPPGQGPARVYDPLPGPGPSVPEDEPVRGVWIYTDELPQPVYEFKPDYPEFGRQAEVQGLVIIHALIGKDGRVIRAEVDEKRSIPLLNETALQAALKWKFTPALANGHPVTVWTTIPFKFVLHE